MNSVANNNKCHSDEKIKDFLKDIWVEGWVIENRIDLSEDPFFLKSMTQQLHGLLDAGDHLTRRFDVNLETLIYSTYDEIVNYNVPTLNGHFYKLRSLLDVS